MNIPFNKPFIGKQEEQALVETLQSGFLRGDGPVTKRVQKKFQEWLGVKHVLLTTSCTHALEMAMLVLDIEPGWEWYDFDPAEYIHQLIDMLIVDGLLGTSNPLARYPAVPLLREYLSDECIIILGDGKRPGMKETARKCAESLGEEIEYAWRGRGIFFLQRQYA